MSLSAGTELGPYRVAGQIGAGGMGEVYRARDVRLGRDVALKILPEEVSQDAKRLSRFEREARAAASLSHPNILGIYDVGRQGDTTYVVMEFLDGETVRRRLEHGPVPVRRAVEYARQVASGLSAAHSRGVVHRDLKPENILITKEGRVKILDFGLAKFIEAGPVTSQAPTLPVDTDAGVVLGTVGYMSPEQVRGKPVDHRSDIFSFGCVLHEMLSGKPAFRARSPVETMAAIACQDPPSLVESNAAVTLELASIVRHCLEKEPGERFQSAADLEFALHDLWGISSSSQPVIGTQIGKFRWLSVAAAVGVVAAIAGVLLVNLSHRTRPGESAVQPRQIASPSMAPAMNSIGAAQLGSRQVLEAPGKSRETNASEQEPREMKQPSVGARPTAVLAVSAESPAPLARTKEHPAGVSRTTSPSPQSHTPRTAKSAARSGLDSSIPFPVYGAPLTNAAIVAMAKASAGDVQIVARIERGSGEQLDASTAALIDLHKQGVHEAIIRAVIKRVADWKSSSRSQDSKPVPYRP